MNLAQNKWIGLNMDRRKPVQIFKTISMWNGVDCDK